ncbi:hypothetical protein HY485_01540 [Candidatus Woesearchaeota archaeon]|nr:hypothetical protein [Candidatus Woesearchaeota archaeon]
MAESIDKIFEEFRTELTRQGYNLRETNPTSEYHKEGKRFAYTVPEQLWMDLRTTTQPGKEPITQVFSKKPTVELINHVGAFYKKAREAATQLNHKAVFTEPLTSNSSMTIYVGLK